MCQYGCGRHARIQTLKSGKVQRHKYCAKCSHHMWKYGITPAERDQMLADQENECITCGKKIRFEKRGSASVDHCHKSGNIRGILCSPCNTTLGLVQENPRTLRNLIKYLKDHSY